MTDDEENGLIEFKPTPSHQVLRPTDAALTNVDRLAESIAREMGYSGAAYALEVVSIQDWVYAQAKLGELRLYREDNARASDPPHSHPWPTGLARCRHQAGSGSGVMENKKAAPTEANATHAHRFECTAADIEQSQRMKARAMAKRATEKFHEGGCPKFCVNGQMAGNCRTSRKMNHDRKQRIDRPAARWLQKA